MCGEELLDEAGRQAVLDEIERRIAAIFAGDLHRPWVPLGVIPDAFKAPATFAASYTPACRLCEASGRLGCLLHGPFRPKFPEFDLSSLRLIGGS